MGDTPYLKVTQMGDNVFHMSSKQATSKELGEAMKSLFKWITPEILRKLVEGLR